MKDYFKMLIIACIICTTSLEHPSIRHMQEYHLENITWFQTPLNDYPVMDMEYDFHVQFLHNECCPLIVIVGDYIHPDIWARECFKNVRLEANWLRHIFYNLANYNEENSNIKCTHNSKTDIIGDSHEINKFGHFLVNSLLF